MNIRTKHRLATGTALAAIALIAASIVWTSAEVEDANRQRQLSSEIVRRYTELRLVGFDYLQSRSERARAQWHATSDRIDRLIAADHPTNAEHAALLAGLRARRAAAPQLFAELGALQGDRANAAARQRFEAQLISRLLIDQQDSLADTFRLAALADQRIEVAERRVLIVILAGLMLIALIFSGLSWLIHRHVLAPIIRLQRITQAVAAGDLSLRLGLTNDDEIGALARNFDYMTQSLHAAFARIERNNRDLAATNQELKAFSYSVSHDLHAPLRSMRGFSLALLEDYGDKLDEDGVDALQRIDAASVQMGLLIDDLLRLSRVSSAELDLAPVNLSAMAYSIAADLNRESPERAVEWRIEPELSALADPALLHIALQNLLRNAWKFTGRTARPVIRVGALPSETGKDFFVADNGAGFDMAGADRLFGAFQRLHAAEDFPGSGIGLAIVRRIIHRHGGELWAAAKVGEGATFFFSLQGVKSGSDQQST